MRKTASAKKKGSQRRVRLPISLASGGTLPGVDLSDSAALLDVMDDLG